MEQVTPVLAGRTILVTGASQGIGLATAQALGAAGAHVIAHYGTSPAGAEAAIADIPEGRSLMLQADLRDLGAVRRLWRDAVAWRGRVDVLVNNAAVMPECAMSAPVDDWDRAWDDALAVNVLAPAALIRDAVGHYLDHGGGVLITLSSWAAQQGSGNPRLVAYAASKAALKAATQTVARAHAADGILAYIVSPGVVDTAMSHRSAQTQGGVDLVKSRLAMGDWIPPSEIADLIAFLASGRQRHLSGATIDVNGATHIR